jgi:thioredoxin 2
MSSPPDAGRPVTVRCPFCATLNRVDLERLAAGPKCAECGKPIRVIEGASVPIVLDCYADWCGPCRMMAPALDEFARAETGRVLVLKLDTDANPATARRLGIRGIPTLIGFQGGREVRRHVGLADIRVLEELVRPAT